MLSTELYQLLQKTYDIVCFVDLADITQSPEAVFQLFSKHYQDKYDENQRLVFYSNYEPSEQLLAHIRKATLVTDISNCFILICCPNKIAQGDDPFQHLPFTCKSSPLADRYFVPDTVCAYPFSHLEINHQGFVRPCCVYKTSIGQVPKQSIKEIFYSDTMEQLRQDFLNGVKPEGCSHCWSVESNGHTSFRQAKLKFYENKLYNKWIAEPAVRSLDLKPSNVCNFKCRICDSRSSSLYAGEQLSNATNPEIKIKIQQLIDGSCWFENSKSFIQEFEELLCQIENLDFYGGEPFLLKNLSKVLTNAVDLDRAQHIRLHFNSNGSVFPDHLLDIFKKFKHVDLAISLDDIGSRFEYERGGVWSEVEENIKKLSQLANDQFNVYLFPTVNVQNVLYLDEVFAWAKENNLNVFLNFLSMPQFMSIDYMTPAAKDLVVEKFQNSTNPELQNVSNRVKESVGSDGQQFVEYMNKLDKWRNQQFILTHPEIANAMGCVLQ